MDKLMIAIPSMDTVPTLFCRSLYGLEKPDNTPAVFTVGSIVHDARNKLAEEALNIGADRVLWIDSDMAFEPDFLTKMEAAMEESGADMVSAMCWRRREPFGLVQFSKFEQAESGEWIMEPLEACPEGILEIEACGFGGVLMKTSLLQDMSRLWGNKLFDPIEGMGEDLAFCVRAKLLGAKIVCDGRVRMGHVGQHVFGEFK